MGVEYFWDLPTRSLSEKDKLTSLFCQKTNRFHALSEQSVLWLWQNFRVRFNRMSQSNNQISHNSDIQEKKREKAAKIN